MSDALEFNIPLDSPLEISAEHTLVNAKQPTFSYNPQSPVGGLLQNSIKYEADGVFCGKYRYVPKIQTTYRIEDNFSSEEPSAILSQNIPWVKPPEMPEEEWEQLINNNRDDILRNFYTDNGVRYAINLEYPETTRLYKLAFVVGFLHKYVTCTGNNIHVTRINDIDDDEELRGKYIIEGRTHRRNESFKLLVDAYTLEVSNYEKLVDDPLDDEGNELLDPMPLSWISDKYELSIKHNKDTIRMLLQHKAFEQDNLAFVAPLFIDHDVSNNVLIPSKVKYDDGSTKFFFDNFPHVVRIYDDGRTPTVVRTDGTEGATWGSQDGFNSALAATPYVRENANSLNEKDTIYLQNSASSTSTLLEVVVAEDLEDISLVLNTGGTYSPDFKFWPSQDLVLGMTARGAESTSIRTTVVKMPQFTSSNNNRLPVSGDGTPVIDVKFEVIVTTKEMRVSTSSSSSSGSGGGGGSGSSTTTSTVIKEFVTVLRYVLYCSNVNDGDWYARSLNVDDVSPVQAGNVNSHSSPVPLETESSWVPLNGITGGEYWSQSWELLLGNVFEADAVTNPYQDYEDNTLYFEAQFEVKSSMSKNSLFSYVNDLTLASESLSDITRTNVITQSIDLWIRKANDAGGNPVYDIYDLAVTATTGTMQDGEFFISFKIQEFPSEVPSTINEGDLVKVKIERSLIRSSGSEVVPITKKASNLTKVKMFPDKMSGIILIDSPEFGGSTENDSRDVGIAFSFLPVMRSYIQDLRFRDSGTNVTTVQHGKELLNLRIDLPRYLLGSKSLYQSVELIVDGPNSGEEARFEFDAITAVNHGTSPASREVIKFTNIQRKPNSDTFTKFGQVFNIPIPGVALNGYNNMIETATHATPKTMGIYSIGNIRDNSIRLLKLRRARLHSSSGSLTGSTLQLLADDELTGPGLLDQYTTAFSTPSGTVHLNYSGGLWSIGEDAGSMILSNFSEYSRLLKWGDEWATTETTSTENLLIALSNQALIPDENGNVSEDVYNNINVIINAVHAQLPIRTVQRLMQFMTLPVDVKLEINQILQSWIPSESKNKNLLGNAFRFNFRDSDKADVEFYPIGIYQRASNNIKYISHIVDEDSVTVNFQYDRRDGSIKEDALIETFFDDLLDKPGIGSVVAEAHDPVTGKMTKIKLANPEEDFAIIQRQYDTDINTEAMYYLDASHIIKKTADEYQLLKMNSSEEWEVLDKLLRTELREALESDDIIISSSVEDYPVLFMLSYGIQGLRIRYFRITESDLTSSFFKTVVINYKESTLQFVDAKTTGFSFEKLAFLQSIPSPSFFLSTVQISSTFINNRLLIGLVYDKGVHQWTLVITPTLNNAVSVFNGYGNVGLDGTVTGSAVPMFAMSDVRGIGITLTEKVSWFKSNTAWVSGNSIVFSDNAFNGGICISAKHVAQNRFDLKSIPLYFNRNGFLEIAGESGQYSRVSAKYFPPINLGVIHTTTLWAYATAVAGLAANVWTVDSSYNEEEFIALSGQSRQEEVGTENWLLKIAFALLAASSSVPTKVAEEYVPSYNDSGSLEGRAEKAAKLKQEIDETLLKLEKELSEEERMELERHLHHLRKRETVVSTDDVKEGIDVALEALFSGSTHSAEAVAVAKARLGSSCLYTLSPNQHIFAGPGFVQAHFAQGSRISGSYSWGHAAKGGGIMYVPTMPSIPIWNIGMLDLNNAGILGFSPVEGPKSNDFGIRHQPEINVGSKHLIYSYPTLNSHEHTIRQTMLAPVLDKETNTLYTDNDVARIYERKILKFKHWIENATFTDACSIIQGVDSLYGKAGVLPVPIHTDAGYDTFPSAGTFDFCIHAPSELYLSATAGEVTGVSVKDTLVMDGLPNNIVIRGSMPLLASSYTCIEVASRITTKDLSASIFSGDVLFLSTTGVNTVKGLKSFHGFDGYTNRIISLTGEVGANVETINNIFSHMAQGPFKTGSLFPPVTAFGKFASPPFIDGYDHEVRVYSSYLGNLHQSVENLQGFRYALPIVHKSLAALPAAKHVIAPYKAHVIDGITSLTTDVRTTSSMNKIPEARDFAISGQMYRINEEYISKLTSAMGTVSLEEVIVSLGLRYLGSTPTQAWLYSPSTSSFFVFTAQGTLNQTAVAFKFSDAIEGTWDFVSQEVVFKMFLDRDVSAHKYRSTELVRVGKTFLGNVYPPNDNIGEYSINSTARGLVLQGRDRGQLHRSILQDYMFREYPEMLGMPGWNRDRQMPNDGLQVNHGNWKRVPGTSLEDFWTERLYDWDNPTLYKMYGYFLEPFKLSTSFIGVSEDLDGIFEWDITFALTPLMQNLLRNKYVTVYIASETIVPGGSVKSDVTRLYLTASEFGKDRSQGAPGTSKYEVGYYTFRYQGRNGAGNSEKLYIWSDGCVALRGLKLSIRPTTQKRTAPLNTKPDVARLAEL